MDQDIGTGTKHWVQFIRNRIRQNKNFLGVFIGQTGSGKSYGALELADLLMKDGLPKENICFKSSSFMARLDDGLRDGSLPKGSVLIWDEAGIGLSAKKWQSKTNKIINAIIQTFRTENLIILFTVPYLSFIDSDARKLIHAFFQTEKIDRTTNEVICKPFNIQVNQITGKMYRKSLRIYNESGSVVKIKKIGLPMPRKELVDFYEDHAQAFKREVITEGRQEIDKLDKDKYKIVTDSIKLSSRQLQVTLMLAQGWKQKEIAEKLGISEKVVSGLLGYAKQKLLSHVENVGFPVLLTPSDADQLNSLDMDEKHDALQEKVTK